MTTRAEYPYSGTVVLVTGAGSGIGEATARAFLDQGASVALVGRTEASLVDTADGHPSDRALVLARDLTDPGAASEVVDATVGEFGRLDAVVAAAGTSEPSPVDGSSREAWDRLRSINLEAVVDLALASAPHLRQSRGSLTVISSIAGLRGEWGMFAYGATKSAVNTLVQGLALDLGADGVRVNAIAPGFTVSRLTEERLDDPEFLERLLDRVALDRVAVPEDIAGVALFLASADAGYITGAVIPVDGGTSASNGTPRPVP